MSPSPLHASIWSGLNLHVVCAFVTITLISYTQLPFHVWRILLSCIYQPPLTLTVFLTSLKQWSLNLERKGFDTDVSFRVGAFLSLLLSVPWSVVGLFVNHYVL